MVGKRQLWAIVRTQSYVPGAVSCGISEGGCEDVAGQLLLLAGREASRLDKATWPDWHIDNDGCTEDEVAVCLTLDEVTVLRWSATAHEVVCLPHPTLGERLRAVHNKLEQHKRSGLACAGMV